MLILWNRITLQSLLYFFLIYPHIDCSRELVANAVISQSLSKSAQTGNADINSCPLMKGLDSTLTFLYPFYFFYKTSQNVFYPSIVKIIYQTPLMHSLNKRHTLRGGSWIFKKLTLTFKVSKALSLVCICTVDVMGMYTIIDWMVSTDPLIKKCSGVCCV